MLNKMTRLALVLATLVAMTVPAVAAAGPDAVDVARSPIAAEQIEQMLGAGGLASQKMPETAWRLTFNGAVRNWDVYLTVNPHNVRVMTRLLRVPGEADQASQVLLKLLDHTRRYAELKILVNENEIWAAQDVRPAIVDAQALKAAILGVANWAERHFLEVVRVAAK